MGTRFSPESLRFFRFLAILRRLPSIMPDDPTHEEEEEEEEEDTFQLTDDQTADFRDAFKKFDAAGQGEIHTDVIKELLTQLDDTLTEGDLQDLISEIDSDGSGWVDYDEFKALMLG